MSRYYVNKNAQSNGDHEVHVTGCNWLPKPENRTLIGDFHTCHPAVREAKRRYPQSSGCYYCCRECHTDGSNETLVEKEEGEIKIAPFNRVEENGFESGVTSFPKELLLTQSKIVNALSELAKREERLETSNKIQYKTLNFTILGAVIAIVSLLSALWESLWLVMKGLFNMFLAFLVALYQWGGILC